ncbi:hemolysin activation/secretion protein [Rhodopseudomonas rhenobacensis]|uniref:Hemolysin activation/secretion protein n=1 Tax=Rhodopseudomonas rhenobacensis TaxID=87461 RepID=A0A7W8DZJ5_9BRAD|nr:ShlB/FhaC/HecB family hemolysin secretion/activation protein [Rhodopseudomonas rhenobacensis]MBB5048424.1 hemolysin activation/secretion protein [Rhodopseudomonas rhenobacensis]
MMPVVASAQTASQITPPSFRPNLERPGGFALPGVAGLATPQGADKLFVRLSGVSVQGGLAELAAASAELERRLVGRPVSGAEVFAAARDLEAAYVQAGYILVRVVLPPQKLINGAPLKLTVVDGFIERVELKDVPEQLRGRIAHLLQPIVGRRGLTLRDLERRVLLAGDTPGGILRSTIAAGQADGASVLIIEAKYQPVSAVLSVDNTLSSALGRTTLGTGVDLNSVAGFGELIYLRGSGHPADGDNGLLGRYPTNRLLAAGVVLPLWIDGLTFNTEFTDARTTPAARFGVQTTDEFQRLSLRMRYAIQRGRIANWSSEIGFDAEEETQSLLLGAIPVPLAQDRLRVVRWSNDGDVLLPWGAALSGRVTASFGLDGLGARSADDASPSLPLSRQGAGASFQKLDLTLGYAQSLLDHLAVNVAFRGQTSFGQALLRAEQFGIANTSGLSSFDAGSIVGDEGYVARGELSSPWSVAVPDLPNGVVAAPYLFAARGEVFLRRPTALEPARIGASAFGGGLRLSGFQPGALSNGTLVLEYGRATRDDGVAASHRFTVVTAIRF